MDWVWLEAQLRKQEKQRHYIENTVLINSESETAQSTPQNLEPAQELQIWSWIRSIVASFRRKDNADTPDIQPLHSIFPDVTD